MKFNRPENVSAFDDDESEDDCVLNRSTAKWIASDLCDNSNEEEKPKETEVSKASALSAVKRQRINDEIESRQKSFDIPTENPQLDDVSPIIRKSRKILDTKCEHMQRNNFSHFNISKPLLKALTAMGLGLPTRIQEETIPSALQGRDVCGCAITGSGKTLAYLIPISERLLYRSRNKQTRVLIISPTRELALQICKVMQDLCRFFPRSLDICMAIGGFDIKSQEQALKLNPDVVIATPGRLIDHLHNSPSFSLSSIEILVLDEADRMMDEYFADQMHEVIRLCSNKRQTLLFSATLSPEVRDLSALSMVKPAEICVDQKERVAPGVKQEFIRIRTDQEKDREAMLLALITRVCPRQTIVFVQTKKQCHRLRILVDLLGVKASELHGAISQEQRNVTISDFREGRVDIMLATDLAARGLDIPNVDTVINFTMPNTVNHYIHRVGRTARAGCSGRSISLCGDAERRMLKDIFKSSSVTAGIMRRKIPAAVVANMRARIASVDKDVDEILELEKSDELMKIAERELKKSEKTNESCTYVNESHECRSWFQSDSEKKTSALKGRLCAHSGKRILNRDEKKLLNKKQSSKAKTNSERRVLREVDKSTQFKTRNGIKKRI